MKEIIGLAVFLTFAGSAVVLSVRGHIGNSLTAIILLFSLLAGWTTANYDWVTRVRWEVPGLEALREEASSARQLIAAEKAAVLEEIREEGKRSIQALALTAGEAQQKVGARLTELESLMDTVNKSEEAFKELERKIDEVNNRTTQLRDQVVAIHATSSELALSLTRVMWLQLETGNEASAERTKVAVQKLLDGLDEVVNLIIVDPEARSRFVSDVVDTLPPPPGEVNR